MSPSADALDGAFPGLAILPPVIACSQYRIQSSTSLASHGMNAECDGARLAFASHHGCYTSHDMLSVGPRIQRLSSCAVELTTIAISIALSSTPNEQKSAVHDWRHASHSIPSLMTSSLAVSIARIISIAVTISAL
jgi:hypothetical protein